jgi:flagellar hook protein FlgE
MNASSIALQGLQQAESQLNSVASQINSVGSLASGGGNVDAVDLSEEMIAMMSAQNLYQENLATLKTADQIEQSLINLMA